MTWIKKALNFAALFAFMACAVPSFAASWPEPISRAGKGQLQCFAPDIKNKTCSALVTFRSDSIGKFTANAVILISPEPFIVMTGSIPVVARAGKLCGTLREQDIETANFSDGNAPLQSVQTAMLQAVLRGLLQDIFNHEICAALLPDGQVLIAKPSKDGVPMSSSLDQRLMWVRPTDGYKVRP